jgi:membrane fusion protein, multidrug efflux system
MNKRMIFKTLKIAGLVLALGGASFSAYAYWKMSRGNSSTDDAYLNADVAQVAAQISGPATIVYVHDNQYVRKGQPLFDIDPAPFEVALAKAQARLAQSNQGVRQDDADVQAARAELVRENAALENARSQWQRTQGLVGRGFLSKQAAEDAQAKVLTQQATRGAAQARLARAEAKTSGGVTQSPDVLAAKAEIAQAELSLSYTHVVAPADGWVSNVTLTPGTVVNANAPLFALIVNGSFRVDANFKETQLKGIEPGQTAEIVVDMYPKHVFHGTVESLSGSTGNAFSLLPPQNATGNWVKVTQRVPVKVHISDVDAALPLRVGATATVKVHLD